MSFSVRVLEHPTDNQIEQLIQLCLRAYNPFEVSLKTLVGGDASLLGAFFSASIRAGVRGGQVYVATEATDKAMIRGMALWWGPGVESFSTAEQQQVLHEFVSRLSPEAQEWHGTIYRPGFAELTSRLLGPRGKLNSWYLNLLAVEPEHQRRGIARSLIDAVRGRANGAELTLAATNDLNVSIYERMGFTARGSMMMSGQYGEFPVYVLSCGSPVSDS